MEEFAFPPLFHYHFCRPNHLFNVTNTEGSAFPPPFDIWGTPPSCHHTSDMCHVRTGRSCSSGGPYTLDSWSENQVKVKNIKIAKKKCFNLKLNFFFICAFASFNLRYIVPYIETYVKFMLFACLLNHTLHFNYWWIYRKI